VYLVAFLRCQVLEITTAAVVLVVGSFTIKERALPARGSVLFTDHVA
jgi:hypothetical protein